MTAPTGRDVARARRATSVDVAREAGLSRATVSYVLNGTPHQSIPEATRRRVLEAARRLGYAPSAAARALRTGRSDVVLLLLPDWPIGTRVGQFLEHLSDALAERGFTLVTHPRGPHARPAADIWTAVGPAAVLAYEEFGVGRLSALQAAGVRAAVSLVGAGFDGPGSPAQQRVGRMQAEHLAAAGHRRLGYAWPDDVRVRDFALARLAGARQACADLGLDTVAVITVPNEAQTAAGAVRAWRTRHPPVTGVCAYNDEVALAVLAGLREEGLAAPTDLAVVGVDDIPAAATAAPALTTVSSDARAQARYIAAVVTARLDDDAAPPSPGSDPLTLVRRGAA